MQRARDGSTMWFLKVFAVLVVSLPMAVFGTFALGDLWAWVETRHGIEAVGHAMYAGWCYGVTYFAIVLVGLLLFALPKRTTSDAAPRSNP